MNAWDVVVVGAGPAGALAARQLAASGASVLLLDRAVFPRWKVCGACLSPGAREVLERVGLGRLPEQLGAVPLRQMVLAAGSRSARIDLRGSLAVSRSALDRALIEAARDAGAHFWDGASAASMETAGTERRVSVRRRGQDVTVSARVVVDASGLGGGLGHAGAKRAEPGSRVGLGAVFGAGALASPRRGELHMIVGRAGYVGLVRLEDGRLNVAAAVDGGRLRAASPAKVVDSILEEGGRDRLDGEPEFGWRGTPALTREATSFGGPHLFRLGDASGYVEPFTGEGMCWAFSSATALALILSQSGRGWSPALSAQWARYQGRHLHRSKRLCRALAWGLRRPRVVRAVVTVLETAPTLAQPFVRQAARVPRPVVDGAG